jgi:two-component system nitrogen regulation sensor histidine kinase NtrY
MPPPSALPDVTVSADGRRRPLDNPRVLTVTALLLIGVLAGLLWLASRPIEQTLPVIANVAIYAVVALALALLVTLGFVLARNLLKLWVERRHAEPFARFRAKLVAALLAMSIVPAVLVLLSGSSIIANTMDRWFSEPVDEVLASAQEIASEYFRERTTAMDYRAVRMAAALPAEQVEAGDETGLDAILLQELLTYADGVIEVYRVVNEPGRPMDVAFVASQARGGNAEDFARASADRLALQTVTSGQPRTVREDLASGAVLVRAARPVRRVDDTLVGAVVASQRLGAAMNENATRATAANERYLGLKVYKPLLQGWYVSLYVTVTLLILLAATWLGLYLAKRITRPVQKLAEGARAIGAGEFDVRLEAETSDELGSLVEAFNMMAAELRTSREKLELSRRDLERTHLEVDARRRYIETILERVATGVISLDATGRISTVNGAASRLLGLAPEVLGQPADTVFGREGLDVLSSILATTRSQAGSHVQEVTLTREDREVHLAAAATRLAGEGGRHDGAVLVLDDVTPLIRAQRVAAWRDVARRLAHEIKNPLTPIQLSAERLRRHFAGAPPPTQALVAECTDAIIVEVEALKGLVDEFAEFARLRGPRMVPADLNRVVDETLGLYGGVLQRGSVVVKRELSANLPPVRLDAEQMRQVIINLVDNALEALGGPGAPPRPNGQPATVIVATAHDAPNSVVRMIVTDNGPGVPAADRDKLFMPYYSTKGRGSGLGLAIVRRIVVEHGGGIEVAPALPAGTTFTVELPAA